MYAKFTMSLSVVTAASPRTPEPSEVKRTIGRVWTCPLVNIQDANRIEQLKLSQGFMTSAPSTVWPGNSRQLPRG